MAANGLQEQNDSCANQLLDFVSNASRELKDMLGKVDRDAESEPLRQPSLRLPSPPFNSPVPSPTPSVVSSISDQEVPTMSPKFFSQRSQRRGRKRDFDSISEASMVEYPSKIRRADSLGDPDEYLDFPTTSNMYMAPMGYYQHQETTYKPTSCRYGNQNSPNQYQMYSSRLQPRLQYQQDSFNNSYQYFPNQPNWPVQNTNYTQNMYTIQQNEHVPDIADLVSWMVAENFLDTESLSLLLTQC